ncbi:NACHT and Ankyrin domain protein [Metarhizium acridum CQMa 102]|uniref:NACHT and Ankyrin domain protein n=1 Tax=Metarhizium acridum (strain CQMa 102) TaxID=655827 RepID=E9DSJ1_METAQ|nr:NACHT and Ankyrin domain protein [Metarhizium acridum CQMa 102]EFY93351.1 NACHT and Ankyrin domain protein [Metarhizium acridum CQMa 102]
METRPANRDDFRVAIICALLCEYNAVSLLFDKFYDLESDLYGRAIGDQNAYTTGRIGPVDAVIVRLSGMGKVIAAGTAASLRSSFPRLELALLTGICGGVPHGSSNEILLGDVILARTVVQYDFGREYHDGFVAKTTVDEGLGRPTKAISNYLSAIQSRPLIKNIKERTVAHLRELQETAVAESWSATYQYPGIEKDKLFEPTHLHKHQSGCEDCKNPDKSCHKARRQSCKDLECDLHCQLVKRPRLDTHCKKHGSAPMDPSVFFGCIGSGDKVMRSGHLRDIIAEKHELLAFEMEGAGVWDEIPCIIVKSVCDYADSHKNNEWQDYAAATAAAATRALLERYPRTDMTRFNACRDALSLRDLAVDLETLKSTKGKRTKGTCEWIKDHEKYQSWVGGDSPFLWISGGPVMGKTMLSIFLTKELKKHTQKTKDMELLFYFCDHQDENRNSAVAVLRSLVHQLVTKRPRLMKNISEYFEGEQKTQTTVSCAETLWMSSKRFRLAIISRKVDGLGACCQVRLDLDNSEHVSNDITKFISTRVEELNKVDDFASIREQVQTTLLNGANGTFLWVSSVITELLKANTRIDILQTLEKTPPGLDAAYSGTLKKIKVSQRSMVSKILRWVVMAVRPLTLKELAAAAQVECIASMSIDDVVRYDITLCEPMLKVLKVDEEKEVVDLVHQSARDYLLRPMSGNDKPFEFHINIGEAHSELLGRCLDYIERSDLRHGPLDTFNSSVLQKSPLLDYATLFWPEHAKLSSTYADEHLRLSRPLFQKRSALRENWCEAYLAKKGCFNASTPLPPAPPLLHLICHFGIELLARKILSRYKIVAFVRANMLDQVGFGPLIYAACEGHETLVRLLLEKGAYVHARDDNEDMMPLSVAARHGHKAIVELLLEKNADINAGEKDGSTALMLAAIHGHDTVMELLLENKADMNAKDIHGRTALLHAVIAEEENMVALLLAHNADPDMRDKNGKTALLIAAESGEEAVVKLLLDYNADVSAKDEYGNTALLVATFAANYKLVQLLLAHGADANVKDRNGNTALLIAADNGDVASIKLLLGHNACVHATDGHYSTALIRAARAGHDTTVELLLENGACINAMDDYGSTALIQAALKVHDTTVKLLLVKGADATAKDWMGGSALELAAKRGHEDIVKLLRERLSKSTIVT